MSRRRFQNLPVRPVAGRGFGEGVRHVARLDATVRVLVVTDTYPPANRGGAGEVAALVADGLAARGHDVLVVTSRDGRAAPTGQEDRWHSPTLPHVGGDRVVGVDAGASGRTREETETSRAGRHAVRVVGVYTPVVPFARRHLSVVNPVAIAQVWQVARQFQPDAVHVHNVHERLSFGSLAVVRGGRTDVPVIMTAHDYLLFCLTKFLCSRGDAGFTATPSACEHCATIRRVPARNRLVHALVRRNVTRLACISAAQSRAFTANGFADVSQTVVHNGLDAATCRSLPSDAIAFRARLGLDARPIVLFGGRASGAKGGDQLVRAMAFVVRRIPAQLVVLGDRPEYFAVVRRIAAEAGLAPGVVHDGGWLDAEALREAHGAAAICAIPSVYPDPFNLMTLRAMLHGRPVVGTCHGATPELVVDGVTGRIADPWDPEAFGNAIADVLLATDAGVAMGEAGRVRGEATFSLTRQIDAYEGLLGG